MTEITLIRRWFTDKSTIGTLYFGNLFECYILEDVDRRLEDGGIKIPKETAIPLGRSQIVMDWSNRFKRTMPHLLDVPQFTGIRIHDGGLLAEPVDTEGCLIPGVRRGLEDQLLESKIAFFTLENKLKYYLGEGEIWITIKREKGKEDLW